MLVLDYMKHTQAGLILEKILHDTKHRYLLCWNGEENDDSAYDCACCITWIDEDLYQRCGCICHQRIEEMASAPHVKLWLLAAEAMNQLPKFFTSYHEKLKYSKEIASQHQIIYVGLCPCEFCEFARNDPKVRKFPLEGEDNSNINQIPASPLCDFKSKENQVCDICQGTEGQDVNNKRIYRW